MTEFGPNKTRGQYFCLKVLLLLLLIALLAFGTTLILLLSNKKLFNFVTTVVPQPLQDEELHLNSFTSVKCIVTSDLTSRNDNTIDGESVIVETKFGTVEGTKRQVFGADVNVFLGIPYASPPVGELRLKRTVPVEKWNGTLKATTYSSNCLQYYDQRLAELFTIVTHEMSEDCLYLNIWSPSSANKTNLKPVMVWVHGGGFTEGTMNMEENNGKVLASFGDVVVVTLNYRLGALGFLDFGIDDSPGNQGLYDQSMAFHWVKDNIDSFGGDPARVTLFGVSSGAISIGLHMVSPQSKNLFKRAILQSGSPIVLNSYYSNSANLAQRIAELLGCVGEDSEAEVDVNEEIDVLPIHKDAASVVKCIKTKSSSQMIAVQKEILENSTFSFTPSPYEELLPLMPTDAIKEDIVKESFDNIKEVLIGLTNDEASIYLYLHSPHLFTTTNVTANFSAIDDVKDFFVDIVSRKNIRPTQAQFVANMFLKSETNETDVDYVKKLHTALSDLAFNCPSITFAEELAKVNKSVYFYVFNHRPSGQKKLAKWMGVPHLSLMPLVFGHPLLHPTRYSGSDIDVSKRIMKSWSHFAYTGKMLPQFDVEWNKFTTHNSEYMEIETTKATMKERYHDDACQLFRLGFDTIERK